MADKLPWQCPEHPDAKIIESWTSTQYTFNGYPRGEKQRHDYRYYCNECERELAKPKDKTKDSK